MQRVERWLQWHFAILTFLCGYLLSADDQAMGLAATAVVAAVGSMILVDRLKWVYLPAPLAYVFMLVASGYSMWIFFNAGRGRQLTAVAILLVMVQAILLCQRKNRRVYEQLSVFCLLQLIVGAVINDALMFGLLLIPITGLLLSAMVLLQVWRPAERTHNGGALRVIDRPTPLNWSDISKSLRRSLILGWVGMAALAATFFYALPRAAGIKPRSSGRASIGFNDELTLDHLGSLAMNPEIVMRVRLTDRETGTNYPLPDGAYLRGVVVDGYSVDRQGVARWRAHELARQPTRTSVPLQLGENRSDMAGYDPVDMHVEMETPDAVHLFAVAPYHRNRESGELTHTPGRWLLERSAVSEESMTGKLAYGFGTYAFFQGRQTEWVRNASRDAEHESNRLEPSPSDLFKLRRFESTMPGLNAKAKELAESLPTDEQQPIRIAQLFSDYLSSSGEFAYTRILGKVDRTEEDPIEDFFVHTRRGHCQYFASALTMMLRSRGIPARIVIGYRMHEFNQLGRFWIVRQQDAHAWVEAYVAQKDQPLSLNIAGQARAGGAWLRLDPTPPEAFERSGQVGQAMELAQSLWQEFVVEMNDQRQSQALYGLMPGAQGDEFSVWQRLQMTVTRIRAGDFGESEFTLASLLSWQAAVVTMVLCVVGWFTWQLLVLFWGWFRRLLGKTGSVRTSLSIAYYAALVRLLSRGVRRQPHETPSQWSQKAVGVLRSRGILVPAAAVARLTSFYYRAVYGARPELSSEEKTEVEQSLHEVRSAWNRIH